MSITSSFYPYDKDNTFYDLETWQAMLGPLLEKNPEAADSLALAFYKVIRVMSEGPAGIVRALNTLKLAMEWIFPYTTTHNLSFKYFLYYVECMLTPRDYPESLLGGAIDRGEEGFRRAFEENDEPEEKEGE
ncbi:MAG TPA: hypothetical protein VEZ90_07630 [Blastocatellia bacterium]|nr:hypothetical protein [Blastocatellia bacterium]